MNERFRPSRRRKEKRESAAHFDKLHQVVQGIGARYEGIINLALPVPLPEGRMGHWQLHEFDSPTGWFGIQPFLIDDAGQRVQDANGEDIVYTSQVTHRSDTHVLKNPETDLPVEVPVILNPNGNDKLRGGESIGKRVFRDTRKNLYLLPDESYIHPSEKSKRLAAAAEIITPYETSQGIPYLRASRQITDAENPEELPEELAIPKRLVEHAVLLSIISEGDYERYRQIYPTGELTEEQFNAKYRASIGKEFGNALVYTPDGSIMGYPGKEINEGTYGSVHIRNLNDARRQEVNRRSELTAIGKVHSHPSQEGQGIKATNVVRKNIPIRYSLVRGVEKSVRGTLRILGENSLLDKQRDIFHAISPPSTFDFISPDENIFIVTSKERIYIAVQTRAFGTVDSARLFSRWSFRRDLEDHLWMQQETIRLFLKNKQTPVRDEDIEKSAMKPIIRTARELGYALYVAPTPHQEVHEEGLVAKKVA